MDIWNDTRAPAVITSIANDKSNWQLYMAQIPSRFGLDEKATYLGFRALGMTPRQAMDVIGQDEALLKIWWEEDPELLEFESNYLIELQRYVGPEVIRLGFLRNMTMFIFQDQMTIKKSLGSGMNNLTQREYDYMKYTRRFYGMDSLVNLDKALNPDKHRETKIVLQLGGGGPKYNVIDPDEVEAEGQFEVEG